METFPMPCNDHLATDLQEKLYIRLKNKPVVKPRLNTTVALPLYSDRIWRYSLEEKTAAMTMRKIDNVFDKISSNLAGLAKTKTGSKYLQGLLSYNNSRLTCKILKGVVDSIFELMADKDGHHLIKRLIDCCDENQFQLLLQLIVSRITLDYTILAQALKNKYTHVIKLQNPPTTDNLCAILKNHFVELSLQKSGSHVVEQCLNSSGMRFTSLSDVHSQDKIAVAITALTLILNKKIPCD
ncbi:hypothetical protein ACFE04_029209 [Oxalis oulophora]